MWHMICSLHAVQSLCAGHNAIVKAVVGIAAALYVGLHETRLLVRSSTVTSVSRVAAAAVVTTLLTAAAALVWSALLNYSSVHWRAQQLPRRYPGQINARRFIRWKCESCTGFKLMLLSCLSTGDHDRPFLQGPVRVLHARAHRQHRHQLW